MVNFWLVPDGMGFHTTIYPAYMVWIPDTWSIFRGCGAPWGGLDRGPQGPRDGRRVLANGEGEDEI